MALHGASLVCGGRCGSPWFGGGAWLAARALCLARLNQIVARSPAKSHSRPTNALHQPSTLPSQTLSPLLLTRPSLCLCICISPSTVFTSLPLDHSPSHRFVHFTPHQPQTLCPLWPLSIHCYERDSSALLLFSSQPPRFTLLPVGENTPTSPVLFPLERLTNTFASSAHPSLRSTPRSEHRSPWLF